MPEIGYEKKYHGRLGTLVDCDSIKSTYVGTVITEVHVGDKFNRLIHIDDLVCAAPIYLGSDLRCLYSRCARYRHEAIMGRVLAQSHQ